MERIKKVGKATKFGNVLREQNCERRGIDNDLVKGLQSFYCRTDTDKFTIVELLFRGRRYHGLSAKADLGDDFDSLAVEISNQIEIDVERCKEIMHNSDALILAGVFL